MYLKNDNLLVRHATTEDVAVLCNWWSDGKIMAHAGFPHGVHTDVDKLMDKIKNENDTSRRLIIEIDSIIGLEKCVMLQKTMFLK